MVALWTQVKRLIRVYTPFVCTFNALMNGVQLCNNEVDDGQYFLSAAYFGYSIIVVAYFFVTSLRMCVWYHLNLVCLLLVQFCGIAYSYLYIDFALYLDLVFLFSIFGILFFFIFKVFYKVTSTYLCIDRY